MSLFVQAQKSRLSDRPWGLEFAPTGLCNSRCVLCDNWKRRPEKGTELTIDEIKSFFRSYRDWRVIGVTGGEPYERQGLLSILEEIIRSQKGLQILYVTTNGMYPARAVTTISSLRRTWRLRGVKGALTHLVSIDGPQQIHDKIHGTALHDLAIKTLEDLCELRGDWPYDVGTVTVFNPLNYMVFDQVLDHIDELTDRLKLVPGFCLYMTGNLYHNEDRAEVPQDFYPTLYRMIPRIQKVLSKGDKLVSWARRAFWDIVPFWIEQKKQIVPCEAARSRYYVNSLGDVYPCIIYPQLIGNLRAQSLDFREIMQTANRDLVREQVLKEECPTCAVSCEVIPSMIAHPLATLWRLL